MANLYNSADISILRFFSGNLEAYQAYYNALTEEAKARVDKLITFIHESDKEVFSGWMYANGKYYTLVKQVPPESIKDDDVDDIFDAASARCTATADNNWKLVFKANEGRMLELGTRILYAINPSGTKVTDTDGIDGDYDIGEKHYVIDGRIVTSIENIE